MVLGLFWVGLILWRNRRRALPEGVCQSAIRVRKAERRDSGAGISSESYGRVSDEPPSRCALMRRSAPRFSYRLQTLRNTLKTAGAKISRKNPLTWTPIKLISVSFDRQIGQGYARAMDDIILQAVGNGAAMAARDGIAMAIAFFAFSVSKAGEGPKWPSILKAVAICALVAMFAAYGLGEPSCSESALMSGGCTDYNDDGYDAAFPDRVKHFAHLFTLTTVAALYGIGKRRPKKQPESRTESI